MSKFNQPTPAPRPNAITAQGGDGFARSMKDELFLLGVSNAVGVDMFYEGGGERDARFVDLVAKNAVDDPEWTAKFIGWLRSGAQMRSASIVAAATYVHCGAAGGRQVIESVLQRPDEPAEMLAYWVATHGRKIPKPVKRGVADAVTRLYTERNLLRYDGQAKTWRFGDVIELTHAEPKAEWQSALFKHAIGRRHNRETTDVSLLPTIALDRDLMETPESERRARLGAAIEAGWSWERLASWLPGGMDAEAWTAVAPNMGLMALTRNLRNMDEANVPNDVAHALSARFMDPDEVRRSRQFPIRFLTAWKNVASMRWGLALEAAVQHSVSNVPGLSGRTLVLVDVSGSMATDAVSGPSRGRGIAPQRWEVAGVFAFALAQRNAGRTRVVLFSTEPRAESSATESESILRLVESVKGYVGGGTDIYGSLAAAYQGEDRVVILTDEQTGAGRYSGWGSSFDVVAQIKAPVFAYNLGGYQVGVTPDTGNWHSFGGLTDAAFTTLAYHDARQRSAPWPWEVDATPA